MINALCLILIAFFSVLEAKVIIYSHYFGQPEYIKYQSCFFERNLLDEYELVVVEDARDGSISKQIKDECEKYGVKYIHIPRSAFNKEKLLIKDSYIGPDSPSFECSIATQYIYDNYVVSSEDVCLIMDNDIFLISPFSIENYLGNYPFAYVGQQRGNFPHAVFYMLPNFVLLNPSIMPEKERLDFRMGAILGNNTDSGGCTYFYLRDYASWGKEIYTHYLWASYSALRDRLNDKCPLMFNSREWSSHYFIEKETFLHIRMGSNWSKHPHYSQMQKEIEILFEELLSQ